MAIKAVEYLMKFIGMYEEPNESAPRDPREIRDADEEARFSTNRRESERVAPVAVNRRGNITSTNVGNRRSYENTSPNNNNSNAKVSPMPSQNSMGGSLRMVVFQPQTYEDTQTIIDNLKARKPIIVNLENLNIDVAQRVLDFISGAIYALDGSVRKVSKGIFLIAPKGVDIAGNFATGLAGTSRGRNYFDTPNR